MTHRHRRDLVRSFVLTGGRAQPTGGADRLDVLTMVTTAPGAPRSGLQPEHLRVIELCRGGYLSVIEVAGHLGQTLTITRILLGDLLDAGLVETKPTPAVTGTGTAGGPAHDLDRLRTLERMLHGLQAL